MYLLSISESKSINGGGVSFSGSQITVTNGSQFSLNGVVFDSNGHIFNSSSKEIYFDINNGYNSICLNDTKYVVSPVQGGYTYTWGKC